MTQETIEHAIAAAGSKATASGAVTSIAGAIFDSGPTFWLGAIIGIAGLLVNWYYKHKDDRRKEREHLHKMAHTNWGDTR